MDAKGNLVFPDPGPDSGPGHFLPLTATPTLALVNSLYPGQGRFQNPNWADGDEEEEAEEEAKEEAEDADSQSHLAKHLDSCRGVPTRIVMADGKA